MYLEEGKPLPCRLHIGWLRGTTTGQRVRQPSLVRMFPLHPHRAPWGNEAESEEKVLGGQVTCWCMTRTLWSAGLHPGGGSVGCLLEHKDSDCREVVRLERPSLVSVLCPPYTILYAIVQDLVLGAYSWPSGWKSPL